MTNDQRLMMILEQSIHLRFEFVICNLSFVILLVPVMFRLIGAVNVHIQIISLFPGEFR